MPLSASQRMTAVSLPPVAMERPVGEKATADTRAECATRGHVGSTVRSRNGNRSSEDTRQMHSPHPSCARSLSLSSPLTASQI